MAGNIYKTTTCFAKLVAALKVAKIIIMQGGQGSGKTTSILQYFIFLAISKRTNLVMSVIGDSLPNLKANPIRIFDTLLKDMGLRGEFTVNLTDRVYTHKKSGNIIEFFSVDGESSKLGARRTHAYFSEVDGIDFDTYLALAGRSGTVIMDFNPKSEFFVHTELVGEPNTKHLIVDYTDNEYLPQNEIDMLLWYKKKAYHDPTIEDLTLLNSKENVKSKYYLNKWRVFGQGQLGVAEGLIFEQYEDWNTIDKVPKEAAYIGAGLDFGFAHVTALVKLYRFNQSIIMKCVLFKKGLTSSTLAPYILNDVELMSSVIAADESRPEMIKELEGWGIPVDAAPKGAGSVDVGLDLMHSFDLLVVENEHESATLEMVKELKAYAYKTDKNGKSLGVPDKTKDVDNSIDASRYGFRYFLSLAAATKEFCMKLVG